MMAVDWSRSAATATCEQVQRPRAPKAKRHGAPEEDPGAPHHVMYRLTYYCAGVRYSSRLGVFLRLLLRVIAPCLLYKARGILIVEALMQIYTMGLIMCKLKYLLRLV